MKNANKFIQFINSVTNDSNIELMEAISKGFITCIESSNETNTVIADKITGSVWGGIWPHDDRDKKLTSVRKESGNDNYEIMSISKANAISDKTDK